VALTILLLSIFQIVVAPVQVLMGIWSLVRGGSGEGIGFSLLAASLSAVLHLAMVTFLWKRARWIATRLVPEDVAEGRLKLRVTDLQVAAFSTVGVVFLLNSIWHLTRAVGRYLDVSRGDGLSTFSLGGRKMTFGDWLLWEPTLEGLVTGGIAIWLMLGSRSIVGWMRRLRKTGLRETTADEPTTDADAA
jgi:hypothetical protein